MLMLSTTILLLSPKTSRRGYHHIAAKPRLLRPLSATPFRSSPSPSGEVYQPFRPPPSPLHHQPMSPSDRLDVLRNGLALWYDYAPHISALLQDGFTPPTVEEVTGISGVEQNRIVVSAKVRDSLVTSGFVEPDVLAYFDVGGAELLYEIRLLSAPLRAASARRIVERRLDRKGAEVLARAVKDFPRRRGDVGWEFFSPTAPGDCVAYSHFRRSREAPTPAERAAALERALEEVDTQAARQRIIDELEGNNAQIDDGPHASSPKVGVPVVRLKYGELAESTWVVVMPVCKAEEGAETLAAAPRCKLEGSLGVVTADGGWRRWVVLPGWEPVMALGGGAAAGVVFGDGAALPWKTARLKKAEEAMVVVDRDRKEVTEEDGLYLVGGNSGGLKVERGRKLRELQVPEVLGTVVLVVRPPAVEADCQLLEEDWD